MELYRGTLISYLCDNYRGEILTGENGSHPSLYFSDKKELATEYGMKMAYERKRRGHEPHPIVIEVEAPEDMVYDIHDSRTEYPELAEKAYAGEKQIFIRQSVGDKFTVPFLFTKYIKSMVLLDMDADSLEEAYESGGPIVINGEQEQLERIFRNMLG